MHRVRETCLRVGRGYDVVVTRVLPVILGFRASRGLAPRRSDRESRVFQLALTTSVNRGLR